MSSTQDFVHLHVHTQYSLLDGLSQIDKLVAHTKALGMSSVAITDHGAMFGVIDFFRAAHKAGVKPIIGMEAYLARRGMEDRDPTLDARPYHLLLLAKNQTGYQNLLKLASAAQLRGYYYRPRVDKELLAQHAEGLIVTTGCLAAEIPRMWEQGKDDAELRKLIGWYREVFGPENFYIELQEHDIDQLHAFNRWLVQNGKADNIPLLATNDTHYVLPEDYDPHDTLLCIQTGNLKSDENRMRMTDPSYHLRSPQEMWNLFGEVPEALTNTLRIAEMCEVELEHEGYHLPVFPVPEGHTEQGYLRFLCEKGLHWRYGEHAADPKIVERLDYELGIIHQMGFDAYFLIVWDLCEFARHADIWWNVRGSGAGSVAAYCLGITSIDPLRNSLIFERFLNPGRVSMPDIDLDYPDDRRAEMIEYTANKYGEDKVAAIITFGTMGSKAAIRDVGRAFALEQSEINRIAGMLPAGAKPVKFSDALGDDPAHAVPELKQAYASSDEVRRLIDTARSLEGVVRHASTHAAGVIVADRPLDEYIPLHRPTKGSAEDAPVKMVTQFDMETCESIGLLKVDFLGLATLTIMRTACELVEKYHGIHYTMENIPYRPVADDPEVTRMVAETFEMIGRGETIGVFQIESSGMRRMLTEMRPKTFENIVAAIALYRPGPMDYIPMYNRRLHSEEAIEYKHPKLQPILEETYGIIVYQEQIMQIASELFGYALGDADLMRRAVSKKKANDLAKHKSIFMERGPEYGVDAATAENIFKDIEVFAGYGFNKSHAADYAVITCQTAFLKAHYPVEYMTALLSVQRDDTAKVAHFTAECRRMGIPILPPDVNRSDLDFTIEPVQNGQRGIRYGLAAVKNAGVGPLEHILEQRAQGGGFRDLADFCKRVDLRLVQKRALESLVKVGALEEFGTRPQLLAGLDRMLSYSAEQHRAADVGQLSLFGDMTGVTFDAAADLLANLPDLPEATERQMLDWEKELVGLYLTSHPLDRVLDYVQDPYSGITQSGEIKEAGEGGQDKTVRLVGLVGGLRPLITRRGETMCILTLEDLQGQIDSVLFPRTWAEHKDRIAVGAVLQVTGKIDNSRGEPQIVVESVTQDLRVMVGTDDRPRELAALNTTFSWMEDADDNGESTGFVEGPRRYESVPGPGDDDLDRAVPEHPVMATPPEPAYVATVTADGASNAPDVAPRFTVESVAPIPAARREPVVHPPAAPAPPFENGGPVAAAARPPLPAWSDVDTPSAPGPAPAPDAALSQEGWKDGTPSWAVETPDDIVLADEPDDVVSQPGLVLVRFMRSDDLEKDRRRLRRLHSMLGEFPGVDAFRIVLCGAQEEVELDFPRHTTCYSAELLSQLNSLNGIEVIWIADYSD